MLRLMISASLRHSSVNAIFTRRAPFCGTALVHSNLREADDQAVASLRAILRSICFLSREKHSNNTFGVLPRLPRSGNLRVRNCWRPRYVAGQRFRRTPANFAIADLISPTPATREAISPAATLSSSCSTASRGTLRGQRQAVAEAPQPDCSFAKWTASSCCAVSTARISEFVSVRQRRRTSSKSSAIMCSEIADGVAVFRSREIAAWRRVVSRS